jgi:hypothetical protein
MNAVAEVQKPRIGVEMPAVRRFELGDLSQHGRWLLPRLVKVYPHLTEHTAAAFLKNILYNSEFHFCYQPHSAGLAQVERVHSLVSRPIVREKFVWVEDVKNPDYVTEALAIYDDFQVWARHHGADVLVIEEQSDVPHELIRDKYEKRIFTRQQHFVRIPPT